MNKKEEIEDVKVKETKERKKVKKEKKEKKDCSKGVLIALLVLVILELCMIPAFVYAGMNQWFPIVMFLVLPTVFAIIVLLLSKNTVKDAKRRREVLEEIPNQEEK